MDIQYQIIPYVLALIFAVSTYFFWKRSRQHERHIDLSKELGRKFVNTIQHQVRAPLTALKGYSSLILEGDYGHIKPELREIFFGMSVSSSNLIDIFDDYMDLACLTFDDMHYHQDSIDLKIIMTKLIQKFHENSPHSVIELKESGDIYAVRGDSKQLTDVFRRLIENSVKYTEKGHVVISLNKNDKKITVCIEDNGIGIAKEDLPHLFKKFYRTNNAQQTSAVGTGLGLYINAQVVKAHYGHIWAESDGISKGSRFFVELPVNNGITVQSATA